MAYAFDRRTPVLRFRGPFTRWRHCCRVLWPALAFRVVAPLPGDRRLNLLQRATLGLCRAGEHTPRQIAARLHLEADLAAFLLKELQERKLLDLQGLPTKLGEALYTDEVLEPEELRVGFVYQDPFEGTLWPRFTEKQAFVDIRPDSQRANVVSLDLGTPGKPRVKEAYQVIPSLPAAAQPEAAEVLEAVRLHHRAEKLHARGARRREEDEEETLAGPDPIGTPPRLERISFIDEAPAAVFLACDVHVPEAGSEGGWQVNDPFGLGSSQRLRRALQTRMEADAGLKRWILGMLDEGARRELERHQEMLAALTARAREKVREELTLGIDGSRLFEPLVQMERARAEVAPGLADSTDRLAAVLVNAQKVLERLFKELNARHPGQHWHALSLEDHLQNRQCLEDAAAALGAGPLPRRIASVPGERVQRTARQGWGTLRPMIAVALLNARHDARHPLRAAVKEIPHLLDLLDELAERRDQAAHDNPDRPLSHETVSRDVDAVYRIVRALLPT